MPTQKLDLDAVVVKAGRIMDILKIWERKLLRNVPQAVRKLKVVQLLTFQMKKTRSLIVFCLDTKMWFLPTHNQCLELAMQWEKLIW